VIDAATVLECGGAPPLFLPTKHTKKRENLEAGTFLLRDFGVFRGQTLSVTSVSGAAGSGDTEGKAVKGSGERGGSRESFKPVVYSPVR
jgi:hypothetical protein